MKIILANDTFPPDVNGSAYFTHRLATRLKSRGHEILVIAQSTKIISEFSLRDGVRVFGVRSFPILVQKGFRVSSPILIKKIIKKAVSDFQPDIIHIQGHFFVGKAIGKIAQELDIALIGTNHFMPENLIHYFPLPEAAKIKIKRWGWKKFREVFEKLEVVTAPTKTAVDLIARHGFSKSVIPISNGIDLEKFNPKNEGDYLKERYGLPKNKPILLYLGRLDKEKKIDLIIQAFAKAIKKIDAHLVIAGKGAERKNLHNLVKSSGLEHKITFTGFVPDEDLANIYRTADCFVIACDVELQSIVTMEAMASGLPIIAVNEMALPELVHHGENGYLFKNGDVDDLAGCIVEMFSDEEKRKRMAEKSLEIIKEHDLEKTVYQFEDIYMSLVGKKKISRE